MRKLFLFGCMFLVVFSSAQGSSRRKKVRQRNQRNKMFQILEQKERLKIKEEKRKETSLRNVKRNVLVKKFKGKSPGRKRKIKIGRGDGGEKNKIVPMNRRKVLSFRKRIDEGFKSNNEVKCFLSDIVKDFHGKTKKRVIEIVRNRFKQDLPSIWDGSFKCCEEEKSEEYYMYIEQTKNSACLELGNSDFSKRLAVWSWHLKKELYSLNND